MRCTLLSALICYDCYITSMFANVWLHVYGRTYGRTFLFITSLVYIYFTFDLIRPKWFAGFFNMHFRDEMENTNKIDIDNKPTHTHTANNQMNSLFYLVFFPLFNFAAVAKPDFSSVSRNFISIFVCLFRSLSIGI